VSLTKQVDTKFECRYSGGPTPCTAREVTYQRNGMSGKGFNVVRFTLHQDPAMPDGDIELLGVVFKDSNFVAVIDPVDLDSHWRGDNFENGLREVVRLWEATL
jgi:hypothetical protein